MKDGDFVHAAISEEVLYAYLCCTSAFPLACRPTIFLFPVESPRIICLVLRGDACVRAAAPFMCVSRARAVAVCARGDAWCMMCAVLCRKMRVLWRKMRASPDVPVVTYVCVCV
jgi:hypothetical protein